MVRDRERSHGPTVVQDKPPDGRPIVQAKKLNVVLGTETVLKNISFNIPPASMTGIIGPNGAGKTTLLRVLLGLVKTYTGTVHVFGAAPHRLGSKRHMIGYVPQRSTFNKRFPISVLDVVAMGRISCRGIGRFLNRHDRRAALESLRQVGGDDLAHRPIGELSGGQQQRVFLARALCSHTRLLLLDEPNTGLDAPAQKRFFELLQTLRKRNGLTVVVVSHDLTTIGQYADSLLFVNRDMHVQGNPKKVLEMLGGDGGYAYTFDHIGRTEHSEG